MSDWQPPETAPKNRTILGDFGWPWAAPALWSDYAGEWVVASIQANLCDGQADPCWINEFEPELRGWMELPEVNP